LIGKKKKSHKKNCPQLRPVTSIHIETRENNRGAVAQDTWGKGARGKRKALSVLDEILSIHSAVILRAIPDKKGRGGEDTGRCSGRGGDW